MGIPNILTSLRLLIGPIFLFIYSRYTWLGLSLETLPFALLGVLLFAEMSDMLDGYIARRLNQVSDFGKIFDPMADCITRICFFLTFTTGVVKIPVIFVMLLIYREIMITSLRSVCALRGVALAARTSGKVKAVIQAIAVFSIVGAMIPYGYGYITVSVLRDFSWYVTGVAVSYTLGCGVEYFVANRETLLEAMVGRTEIGKSVARV